MRRALPIALAATVAVGYLLLVSLAPTPPMNAPPASVFSESASTAAPPSVTPRDSVDVVKAYWTAINEADPVAALGVVSDRRPSWEAELGFAEYTSALGRAYAADCALVSEGRSDVVTCDVAPTGVTAEMRERFTVRDGAITRIERSDVAALSDAVLVRLARTFEPDAFDAACVDTSGRWYRPNGVTYNAECGRLLASISPDRGWFAPHEVGLWLLSGGP